MDQSVFQQFLDYLYRLALSGLQWIGRHPVLIVLLLLFSMCLPLSLLLWALIRPRWRRNKENKGSGVPAVKAVTDTSVDADKSVDSVRFIVLLPELAKKITSADTLEKIAALLLKEIHLLFPGVREVGLFLPERSGGGGRGAAEPDFVVRFCTGIPEKFRQETCRIPFRKGLIGFAAYQGMILWRQEMEQRFGRQIANQDQEYGFYSPSVAVPLILRNHLLGILTLHPLQADSDRRDHHQILSILSDLIAISLSHAQKMVALQQTNRDLGETSEQLARFNQDLKLEVHRQTAELKATEHQLFQAEQLALFGEFVATLTHDIKNPLAFISGESQWALELVDGEPLDRDGLKKSLEIIAKNSLRLQQELQSLLGRLQIPKMNFEKASLVELASETVALIDRHAKQRGFHVTMSLPTNDRAVVECLPGLLRHAIMNLLTNALDALEPGGRVTVGVRPAGKGYEITIQDTGKGIDPDDLSHIFELFYTKRKGGAGLGLSSVKRIIEAKHHGRISVQSERGRGTTFVLRIPTCMEDGL